MPQFDVDVVLGVEEEVEVLELLAHLVAVLHRHVELEVRGPGPNSNLRPDFNASALDGFDAKLSAVLRDLDESDRFVQKSAESTSI